MRKLLPKVLLLFIVVALFNWIIFAEKSFPYGTLEIITLILAISVCSIRLLIIKLKSSILTKLLSVSIYILSLLGLCIIYFGVLGCIDAGRSCVNEWALTHSGYILVFIGVPLTIHIIATIIFLFIFLKPIAGII